MPNSGQYLLDTNVLVALVRGGPLGQYIDQTYQLTHQPFRPLICIVTVGEIKKLVKQFGWEQKRIEQLEILLSQLIWVDISEPALLDAYAEIAHFSESNGKTIPQNDYWIAAATQITNSKLRTTDTHFDHLHGQYIDRKWIDERVRKQAP